MLFIFSTLDWNVGIYHRWECSCSFLASSHGILRIIVILDLELSLYLPPPHVPPLNVPLLSRAVVSLSNSLVDDFSCLGYGILIHL